MASRGDYIPVSSQESVPVKQSLQVPTANVTEQVAPVGLILFLVGFAFWPTWLVGSMMPAPTPAEQTWRSVNRGMSFVSASMTLLAVLYVTKVVNQLAMEGAFSMYPAAYGPQGPQPFYQFSVCPSPVCVYPLIDPESVSSYVPEPEVYPATNPESVSSYEPVPEVYPTRNPESFSGYGTVPEVYPASNPESVGSYGPKSSYGGASANGPAQPHHDDDDDHRFNHKKLRSHRFQHGH